MKINLLIFGILLTCSFQLVAQSYDIAMGVRLGTDMGITYKHRIAKRVTLEGIVQSSFYREEANVTVLAENHMPFLTRRLNFYTGGGFHKGWVTSSKNDLTPEDPFGVTLIAGIEFTAARVNISYDFKPAINIIGGDKTIYSQSGISVRYVMKKRKIIDRQKNKNRKKRNSNKKKINWKFWEQ